MSNLNRLFLIGRVGSEPDVRNFGNGNKVANCSLAVTERYKDKNGQYIERPTWFRLRFFGKMVDVVEKYVHSGDTIYVEGQHVQREYENKDGQKVATWEVRVLNFQFLTQKNREEQAQQEADNDMPYFE